MPKGSLIRRHILALLGKDQIRMTPSDLEGALHNQIPRIKRTALRKAIKAMVTEGVLVYTNHYSTTHIELNFNRPMQVSERVILCPATSRYPQEDKSIIIKLQDGAAFGIGDHPTTRLCIQGLDNTLAKQAGDDRLAQMKVLDIGTGSAVLAMVAVGLGFGWAKGIDTDPLACGEAKKNLKLNGMTHCITITNKPLDKGDSEKYDVILANLRPPTLKQLFPLMEKVSAREAIWVLSGFRKAQDIKEGLLYSAIRAEVIWQSKEQGWAGLALRLNRAPKGC